MQAEGSPLNPTEMANPDPACVVRRISERPYRGFFESIWGPRAFNITWPDDVDALCSRPNDNPGSAIGSEVPGPNTTPLVVKLSPADRARAQSTFDQMAEAIAAYEASPEVSPFSSKFDAYLAGSAELSEAERRGDSQPLRLMVVWDGKWDDGASEIGKRLVVSPDPPLSTQKR